MPPTRLAGAGGAAARRRHQPRSPAPRARRSSRPDTEPGARRSSRRRRRWLNPAPPTGGPDASEVNCAPPPLPPRPLGPPGLDVLVAGRAGAPGAQVRREADPRRTGRPLDAHLGGDAGADHLGQDRRLVLHLRRRPLRRPLAPAPRRPAGGDRGAAVRRRAHPAGRLGNLHDDLPQGRQGVRPRAAGGRRGVPQRVAASASAAGPLTLTPATCPPAAAPPRAGAAASPPPRGPAAGAAPAPGRAAPAACSSPPRTPPTPRTCPATPCLPAP